MSTGVKLRRQEDIDTAASSLAKASLNDPLKKPTL